MQMMEFNIRANPIALIWRVDDSRATDSPEEVEDQEDQTIIEAEEEDVEMDVAKEERSHLQLRMTLIRLLLRRKSKRNHENPRYVIGLACQKS
mmetsp:Transcript_25102/g.41351  ORF Transcript_25102/g.41351 Transcript_25102/m.41351 type:complete len:93 (+) Transcript_25102:619-897(+)